MGNKTYEHYNEVAIYVDKRLEELGATRVFDLGLGDDDAKLVLLKYNNYLISNLNVLVALKMISLHGKINFGQPYVNISVLNQLVKMLAFVNIDYKNLKMKFLNVYIQVKWLDCIPLKPKDRMLFFV